MKTIKYLDRALPWCLKKTKKFKVAALLTDGKELSEYYFKEKPDVILADIEMNTSGTDAAAKLLKEAPEARILFLSVYYSDLMTADLYRMGAWGFLPKDTDINKLAETLIKIASGEKCFDFSTEQLEEIKTRMEKEQIVKEPLILKEIDQQILYFISKGLTTAEIGKLLNHQEKSIESRRSNLIKLFTLSTGELTAFALNYARDNKFSLGMQKAEKMLLTSKNKK